MLRVRQSHWHAPHELQGYWDALAVDAVIVDPLAASAWSAGFGMLTDRFGVTWSFSVTAS
ncbi:hypothetical protein BJF79_34075 [Actinomadura sp. CNU-125]|uniref:hypothetical protein n=1 Tax=Actinomadura sp. CNU-125 TaxID=1904961 RepID=UPI000959D7AA|nr:hypothetical protein [Actinomadura sp. CNU-125]OLT33917.1 hypothetical protein BJF79_34075 [Actinomadura sp. CNU-125]